MTTTNLLVTVTTEDDTLLSLSAEVDDETFLLAAVERAVIDTVDNDVDA